MGFVEKYVGSLNSSDLRDDELHHSTDALIAAAMADATGNGAGLGSLLSRVKFADGTPSKVFESGTQNLAALLRIWCATVRQKGISRGWMPARTAWDMQAAETLYRRVAEMSLAYWMDGRCTECKGAGQLADRRLCPCCKGSCKAEIDGWTYIPADPETKRKAKVIGRFEASRVKDLVSELEGLVQAHNTRAASWMRRKD